MISFVFDTETTGLPVKHAPASHPDQPEILQLCGMLCDDTRVYSMFNVYVHGDTPVPDSAFQVHRIDREMTARVGITRTRMVQIFSSFAEKADVIVGHNLQYDMLMMRVAMIRENGKPDRINQILGRTSYCTMQNSTQICKIPHAKPRRPDDYKWPSLQEAYKKLVDPRGFEGAHDAFADVTATYDVYKVLRQGTNAGV